MNKPKATNLRVLEGNPGKRRINKDEPKPRPVAPSCPSWLGPEAKAEWKRMLPVVERMGVMTEADGAAFAGYCQAWEENRLHSERIVALATVEGVEFDDIAAVYRLRDKAALRMRSFASEFGFTPSSRTKLTVKPSQEHVSELRELLS